MRAMLAGAIDYAGLFPPAALGMAEAAENYAAARGGNHGWMLGRYVVPIERLPELVDVAVATGSGEDAGPWPISVLAAEPSHATAALISEFNRRHAESGVVVVEAVEAKASGTESVEEAARVIPLALELFFELPLGPATPELIRAVALRSRAAKVRAGGIAPAMVPSSEDLARFVGYCADIGVPFKATAGLHHPLRSERPLTYDAEPPRAKLHGFINLMIAAALAATRKIETSEIAEVLEEEARTAFVFDDSGVQWRRHQLTADDLGKARSFVRSFGSCSFQEPIDDLKELGWL
jgi:hypothetical protein